MNHKRRKKMIEMKKQAQNNYQKDLRRLRRNGIFFAFQCYLTIVGMISLIAFTMWLVL
mgnify:CR=1 FL=1|tara:strand:- start:5314 stop:5487 length:174 start_codon:yes stop_codon:yes gene_type:complete